MTLRLAGTGVDMSKPHNTRAAVTSVAHRKGVQVEHILKMAEWSNEKTFARFYNKPLESSVGLARFDG